MDSGRFGIEAIWCTGVICLGGRLRNRVLGAAAMLSLDKLIRFFKAIVAIGTTSVRANSSSSSVYSRSPSSARTPDSIFESGYLLLYVITFTPY